MTLIFIMTLEVKVEGSHYQEVWAWTFFFFFFCDFLTDFSVFFSLLIFLFIAHLSHIYVLALLVHIDKQGFCKKTRSKLIFRTQFYKVFFGI